MRRIRQGRPQTGALSSSAAGYGAGAGKEQKRVDKHKTIWYNQSRRSLSNKAAQGLQHGEPAAGRCSSALAMKEGKQLKSGPVIMKKRSKEGYNGTRTDTGALILPLWRFFGTPIGEDSIFALILFLVDRILDPQPAPVQMHVGSTVVQIPCLLGKLLVCAAAFCIFQLVEAYLFKSSVQKAPWSSNIRLDLTKKGRPAYRFFLTYTWLDGRYYVLPDKRGEGYAVAEVTWRDGLVRMVLVQ